MRDMEMTRDKGKSFLKVHPATDLHVTEIAQLVLAQMETLEKSEDKSIPLETVLFDAIYDAYCAGLAAGVQYERGRTYRARRKGRQQQNGRE